MEIGVWQAAQRVLREYGANAQAECLSRATYHDMQGDTAVADGWRRAAELIERLQQGQSEP